MDENLKPLSDEPPRTNLIDVIKQLDSLRKAANGNLLTLRITADGRFNLTALETANKFKKISGVLKDKNLYLDEVISKLKLK